MNNGDKNQKMKTLSNKPVKIQTLNNMYCRNTRNFSCITSLVFYYRSSTRLILTSKQNMILKLLLNITQSAFQYHMRLNTFFFFWQNYIIFNFRIITTFTSLLLLGLRMKTKFISSISSLTVLIGNFKFTCLLCFFFLF